MCAIIGFTSPTMTKETIRPYFDTTVSRGPDDTRMEPAGKGYLGFLGEVIGQDNCCLSVIYPVKEA